MESWNAVKCPISSGIIKDSKSVPKLQGFCFLRKTFPHIRIFTLVWRSSSLHSSSYTCCLLFILTLTVILWGAVLWVDAKEKKSCVRNRLNSRWLQSWDDMCRDEECDCLTSFRRQYSHRLWCDSVQHMQMTLRPCISLSLNLKYIMGHGNNHQVLAVIATRL